MHSFLSAGKTETSSKSNDPDAIVIFKKQQSSDEEIKSFEIEGTFSTLFSFKDSLLKNFYLKKNIVCKLKSKKRNKKERYLEEIYNSTKKSLAEEYFVRRKVEIKTEIENSESFIFLKKNHK